MAEKETTALVYLGGKRESALPKCLKYVFVILFFVNVITINSQSVRFRHLTVNDGLSQSTIYCILQDAYGFMWFGTGNGLNSYNGYNFKVYKHNRRNQHTISNNFIICLFEDSRKNLWIGTNQGLNFYDRQNDCIKQNPKWPQNAVKAIAEDENNNLWIATITALYYFDIKNDTLRTYRPDKDSQDNGNLRGEFVVDVFIDSKKNVWIGTNKGLNLYDKKKDAFINYYHDENDQSSLINDEVRAILEDKDGRLWIGTSSGLDLFVNAKDRPKKGKFIHFQNSSTDQKVFPQVRYCHFMKTINIIYG